MKSQPCLNNQDCREKAEKVLRTLGMEAAQFYVSEGVIEEAVAEATTMQRVSQKKSFGDKVTQLETLRAPFREKLQSIFPVRDQLQQGVTPKFWTPKVLALLDRLKELSKNDCRFIVFVEEVASTWPLAYLLRQHVKEGVGTHCGRKWMGKRQNHLEAGFAGLPHSNISFKVPSQVAHETLGMQVQRIRGANLDRTSIKATCGAWWPQIASRRASTYKHAML